MTQNVEQGVQLSTTEVSTLADQPEQLETAIAQPVKLPGVRLQFTSDSVVPGL